MALLGSCFLPLLYLNSIRSLYGEGPGGLRNALDGGAPEGESAVPSEETFTRMPMSLSTCAVAGVVGTCSAMGESRQPGVRAIMGLAIGCCFCLLLGVCRLGRGRRGVVVAEEEEEEWLQCWPFTLNASSLSRSRSSATYGVQGKAREEKEKTSLVLRNGPKKTRRLVCSTKMFGVLRRTK